MPELFELLSYLLASSWSDPSLPISHQLHVVVSERFMIIAIVFMVTIASQSV